MAKIQWGKFSMVLVGATALGYGVMTLATPTEEQYYKALSPRLKKEVDERRIAMAEEAAGVKKQPVVESKTNSRIIWAADREPVMPHGTVADADSWRKKQQ